MRVYVDYNGEKVGMLTIGKFANKRGSSGSIFNATCDCGNEREVSARTIKRAINKGYNISCGKCEGATRINKTTPEVSAFTHLFNMYRSNAGARYRKFELNWESFKEITKMNCHYCGIEPKQICKNSTGEGEYIYNGIDRVDSSGGYTKDNIVPCCGTCNKMKNALTTEEFLDHISKIHWHSNTINVRFGCKPLDGELLRLMDECMYKEAKRTPSKPRF